MSVTKVKAVSSEAHEEHRQAWAHSPGMARLWHSIARWYPIKILLTQLLSIWLALGQDQCYLSMWLKHSDLSGCSTGFLQDYALGGWLVNTILMAFTCACPLQGHTPTAAFPEQRDPSCALVTALFCFLHKTGKGKQLFQIPPSCCKHSHL